MKLSGEKQKALRGEAPVKQPQPFPQLSAKQALSQGLWVLVLRKSPPERGEGRGKSGCAQSTRQLQFYGGCANDHRKRILAKQADE